MQTLFTHVPSPLQSAVVLHPPQTPLTQLPAPLQSAVVAHAAVVDTTVNDAVQSEIGRAHV